jgi:hypothetical protein
MISFVSGSRYWLNFLGHKVMAGFLSPSGGFTDKLVS